MSFHDIIAHPASRGALSGALAAAAVDIHSFVVSKTWHVEGFDITLASKRWFTGALTGAAAALGLSYLL